MAIYNTPSDAANTAVRSFLTQLGEQYYGGKFNTGSGPGKETWKKIREEEFVGKCAYCDAVTVKPTIEHLVMFNREQCGLHHSGNIAPCCNGCNKRLRTETKQYTDWDTHLAMVVENNGGSISDLNFRKKRIKEHMGKWGYPKLTTDELNAIRALANSLYAGVQAEVNKSVSLFQVLDRTLIQGRGSKA